MKRALITLALVVVLSTTARAFTFEDIQLWAGTGSNQAALVIDWNDGISPESLVWGFRWDGVATGKDMFDAVLAADSRLFASMEFWPAYNGYTVYGIGYDLNGNGSSFVVGVREDAPDGYPGSENGYATDPLDHYKEGWFTGYWSYWVAETAGSLPSSWGYSGWGLSARQLSNGSWDGWSFVSDMSNWTSAGPPSTPTAATAIPEPSSILALASGVIGLVSFAARRRV